MDSLLFTIVTFVGFTALVAIISWWKTRGDNLETQDGYYLAGRGLTGPIIAGSLLMTNLSAEQLVGMNGQSVRIGMSPMGWEVTSAIALVILAFVLMPKYLKTGLTTVPEFFEQRYDAGTRRLVSIDQIRKTNVQKGRCLKTAPFYAVVSNPAVLQPRSGAKTMPWSVIS